GRHEPFSIPKMKHHLGSNCIRSLPAKGWIAGYTELGVDQSAGDANIEPQPLSISPKRNFMEYLAPFVVQSAFTPANLTTLAHFSVSSAMSLPKSAGVPVMSAARPLFR